jgi:hypothetical protein
MCSRTSCQLIKPHYPCAQVKNRNTTRHLPQRLCCKKLFVLLVEFRYFLRFSIRVPQTHEIAKRTLVSKQSNRMYRQADSNSRFYNESCNGHFVTPIGK